MVVAEFRGAGALRVTDGLLTDPVLTAWPENWSVPKAEPCRLTVPVPTAL